MQLKVTHMHLVFPLLCETLGDSDIWCPVDALGYSFSRHPSIINHQSSIMSSLYTIKVRVGAIYAPVFLCSKVSPEAFILTVHRVAAVPSDSQ